MVQHHVDEFADRNLFLQLCLAALSLGARLDGILARHAPPDGAPAGPALPGDALLVDAALGLIALRARTAELLAAAAVEAPSPAPAATPRRIPLR